MIQMSTTRDSASHTPPADPDREPLPVYDLHCDLLTYLCGSPEATPYDPAPRCSIPQMRAGQVAYQTLAIFGATGRGSSEIGPAQARMFARLCAEHPDEIGPVVRPASAEAPPSSDGRREPPIRVLAALENASVFCEEDESLDDGFTRFEAIERVVGRVLYVSLTWHDENRFAGGNGSTVGLKDDGRTVIEFLAERGVALDFSHTSTRTARDAIDFITARGLRIPLLASHSNFAACLEHPRNLADDVARAILERDGVIGINFMRAFLGAESSAFIDHIRHGLELGRHDGLCLGADFFPTDAIPESVRLRYAPDGFFFPEYQDAGCYQDLLEFLASDGSVPPEWLPQLAAGNAHRFLLGLGIAPEELPNDSSRND